MKTGIQQLFDEIRKCNFYPDTMLKICGEIKGTAFFPGGVGTIDNSEDLFSRKIMILGQDFDCETNFNESVKRGFEDIKGNPTWRNILKLLKECQIKIDECFFTNAILGIRKGSEGTGKSPAFQDLNFIDYCRSFFIKQVELQKPRLIIVLGKYPALFLAPINEKLSLWKKFTNFKYLDENNLQVIKNVIISNNIITNFIVLVHPSLRHLNIAKRKYLDFTGHEAEIQMIKEGLNF